MSQIALNLVHCSSCYCKKNANQVSSNSTLSRQRYAQDKECCNKINQRVILQKWHMLQLWSLHNALPVTARNKHTTFRVIWTDKVMLRTKSSIKLNQRAIIKKGYIVELQFWCNALQDIAGNKHTKFAVICLYNDKVMIRTRNAT